MIRLNIFVNKASIQNLQDICFIMRVFHFIIYNVYASIKNVLGKLWQNASKKQKLCFKSRCALPMLVQNQWFAIFVFPEVCETILQ